MNARVALMIAGAAIAPALEAQRDPGGVAGTYRIAVCKVAPCTPHDTVNALTSGLLVLADSALPIDGLPDSVRYSFDNSFIEGAVNGCYVLRQRSGAKTYAGIAAVGLTRWWDMAAGEVSFTLYQSPDAAHEVRARIVGDTLRGIGESVGVGAAEVHFSRDTVVGVRIGPPRITPCTDASTSEWRRRRAVRRPPNDTLRQAVARSRWVGLSSGLLQRLFWVGW